MSAGIDPEERARVLVQHRDLRALLSAVDHAAKRVRALEAGAMGTLRDGIRDLDTAFRAHLAFEESLLVPVLPTPALSRLRAEHHQQRTMLEALASDTAHDMKEPTALAEDALWLVDVLLTDMRAEERAMEPGAPKDTPREPKEVAMLCEDIMQHPVKWIAEDDTARTAARLMRDENIGFLPVCDQSGRVVGTLTDRDLAIRVIAEDLPAGAKVREVMTRELVTCKAKDELGWAEQLMSGRHKSRIVCIDEGGHLTGIISIADVAKHDEGPRVARTLRQILERETR
jgi:CBS domain-containing protein